MNNEMLESFISYYLKLNDLKLNKTEFSLFDSKMKLDKISLSQFRIGSISIIPVSQEPNLGVKLSTFLFKNLGKMQKFLH